MPLCIAYSVTKCFLPLSTNTFFLFISFRHHITHYFLDFSSFSVREFPLFFLAIEYRFHFARLYIICMPFRICCMKCSIIESIDNINSWEYFERCQEIGIHFESHEYISNNILLNIKNNRGLQWSLNTGILKKDFFLAQRSIPL